MKISKATSAKEQAIAIVEVELAEVDTKRLAWDETLDMGLELGHEYPQPDEIDEAYVAWCMDRIREYQARVEYAKIRAAAIIRHAEQREQYVYGALWIACAEYAEANRPKKGKSVHVEGTDLRLQWRRSPDRLSVRDERTAISALQAMFGFEKAQELGFTRVKEEVSVSTVKQALKDGTLEEVPAGCQVVRGIEKLHLQKKRGTTT